MTLLLSLPHTGKLLGGVLCKISSEDTQNAFTVLELTLQQGQGAPLHIHARETETFVVMEGILTVECDGITYQAPKESVVVLPRGSRHAFRNEAPTPCRILITAIPGGLDAYFAEIHAAGSTLTPELLATINAKYEIDFL